MASADQTDTQEAPIVVNGTQDFVILRAEQFAGEFEGVTACSEATSGGNDGAILGLPSGSEWRTAFAGADRFSGELWAAAPEGGTLGGLAPGVYEVRIAGDSNHNPFSSVEVTVSRSPKRMVELRSLTVPLILEMVLRCCLLKVEK